MLNYFVRTNFYRISSFIYIEHIVLLDVYCCCFFPDKDRRILAEI